MCVLLSLPLPLFVTLNQYGLRRLVVASQTAQHAVSGHGNVAASNDRDDHKVRVVASCVFVALCILYVAMLVGTQLARAVSCDIAGYD